MEYKKYVAVVARFNKQGLIVPLSIEWEDGHIYEIDRIIDTRRAASMKAGGSGIRYTCMISGHKRYLYYEDPAWFVPAKGLEGEN